MNVKNIFDLWANDPYVPSLCFEVLSDVDTTYWASRNRWPLLAAIYLSMGLNPQAKPKLSGKLSEIPTPDEKQESEFFRRIRLAYNACEDKSLLDDIVAVPDKGFGGPAVDREVDTRIFIEWAREHFEGNCDTLFELALKSHKSTAHRKAGGNKGKQADDVKDDITANAIEELVAGCKCHNPELARFLMKLINTDGTPKFILPGIIKERYEDHFNIATIAAFKKMGIPLRNEPKNGAPRGKKYCSRPGHNK